MLRHPLQQILLHDRSIYAAEIDQTSRLSSLTNTKLEVIQR
jgi:hypothetical protein